MKTTGGEWTAREIAQQPAVWLAVADLVAQERLRLDAFLAPLLDDARVRIVLTGAGTSSYIGGCLAPDITRHLDRRVDSIASTDLVSGPHLYLQRAVPTLLVSFARSGGSPESVAAVDVAERALDRVFHLVITCNGEGALAKRMAGARNACVLVLPEATNDRAFAMTSSFTSMVLAAALAFGVIPAGRVAVLARAGDAALPRAQALACALAAQGFERVVYLGSNALQSLAAESALKMLELTDGRTVAVSQSVLGFRHGPKTIVNARTLIVVYVSNDPYTRAYDRDLLEELSREARAGAIVAVGAEAGTGEFERLELTGTRELSDLELALIDVIPAQLLGLAQSLRFGLTPDNPNVSGVVSRVVQGVTIHPWSRELADVSRR
ncbi:MAG: SIS domain-containing protein [Pseudomonadota bacterium]